MDYGGINMATPCMKGWNDIQYNTEGRCCCNCVHQRPLVKHPWNKDPEYKGSLNEGVSDFEGTQIFVCLVDTDRAMSSDREHSMCEMHTFKGE